MKKDKKYPDTRFTVETLRECFAAIKADCETKDFRLHRFEVNHGIDGTWEYDSEEEFFADYRKATGEAHLFLSIGTRTLSVSVASTGTTLVSVAATRREDVDKFFNIFERDALSARQPSNDDASDKFFSLKRDEPSFTMSRAIPALFVSKDLIEAVRIAYLERIKNLLAEKQEKYEEPEMSITIEDQIGIATIKSMKEFAPAKFADSTRAIRLRYDGMMHRLYNQRIDISFTMSRETSELDLTTSGSTARESAEGTVQQLFSLMEANCTNGEWRNPRLHHQFFAFVAILCATIWMIANSRNLPWAAQVSISVGLVLAAGFLIITPKLRPYIEFDTRRTKIKREWSATISKTFWSAIVLGTVVAIFKDYILRQLGLK